MKFAFVRFIEDHGKESGALTCVVLARGSAAESQEAFISWHNAEVPIKITSWFAVPENWENAVAGNNTINDALEALVGLDALSDTPLVSDLLATIFAAGFRCGEKHVFDVQSAFSRERAATYKM